MFNVNCQEKQLLFDVKRFEGLSKITISSAHPGLQALKKKSFFKTGKYTSFMVFMAFMVFSS